MIRQATLNDIENILEIFNTARTFMRTNNNNQWNDNYPNFEIVKEDIINKNCYLFEENNEILGVFSFIIGEDSTYKVIENGSWSFNEEYGTIHRLASNGKVKGLGEKCFDFCFDKINYIRIDTHNDNAIMKKLVTDYGFKECGIIYVKDGSPRIAYDLKKNLI